MLGADVIEIGLPYSDPLMDGPVIAEAVHRALAAGTKVTDVLRTVEAVAAAGIPALIMTYWNPVDRYGVRAFARDLAQAGGSGLITPDLSPEEAGPWLEASDEFGLDRVFLAAPSSTDQRIATITAACRGFVYAASLMGITGTRDAVSAHAGGLVQRIRPHTELPVAVGSLDDAEFADIAGQSYLRRVNVHFPQRSREFFLRGDASAADQFKNLSVPEAFRHEKLARRMRAAINAAATVSGPVPPSISRVFMPSRGSSRRAMSGVNSGAN